MMTFKYTDETHFATNSIKPCSITKFEDDYYELHMPKGDYAVTFPVKLGFDTFDEAKRWAEERVGMRITMKGREI